MVRHFLNPPNWFTSASIFCSVYAMTLLIGTPATPEILAKACLLVVFGGIFDMLDGRVARMTNRFTEFGVQLDSIADIISFGVAPALIVWAWSLHELGALGAIVTFWWVLAAAFRLARFNVNTARGDWQLKGHSQGLTSTMGGGLLVTFAWVSNDYMEATLNPPPWVVATLVALLGLAMVSSMPWRSFRDARENKMARRMLGVSLALCLAGAVTLHPSMWFGVGGLIYISLGFVDSIVTFLHFRRVGRNLPGDEEEEELAVLATEDGARL